jgi:hypothetical protein
LDAVESNFKLQISRKREIPEEEQGKEVFQPVLSALEFEF